jgi:hypothetical protein
MNKVLRTLAALAVLASAVPAFANDVTADRRASAPAQASTPTTQAPAAHACHCASK